MAYGNVTPPALPEYDTAAYPYAVIVFNYEAGAEDWYQVHLYYSGTAFTHNGSYVTNAEGVTRKDIYGDGSWTGELTVEAAPELAPGMNGEVYQRIWTNHDILRDDGTVYLAADAVTPISTFDLRSFLTGLTLGLAGKPVLIGGQKTPVAYLYNGVRLPKLPEWDRGVYPYAYIQTAFGDTYLFVSTARLDLRYYPDYGYTFTSMTDATFDSFNYERYALSDNGENWGDKYTGENAIFAVGSYNKGAVWCNTDLYRYDKDTGEATLIQTASEPVPVYE